jgi:hypothetical protein
MNSSRTLAVSVWAQFRNFSSGTPSLPNDQLIDRVEAVVICRGAEPTGFLEKLAVPIALEHAFEELWQQASKSLSKLWEKLSSHQTMLKAHRVTRTLCQRYRSEVFGFQFRRSRLL